jgi:hypothetical protein
MAYGFRRKIQIHFADSMKTGIPCSGGGMEKRFEFLEHWLPLDKAFLWPGQSS